MKITCLICGKVGEKVIDFSGWGVNTLDGIEPEETVSGSCKECDQSWKDALKEIKTLKSEEWKGKTIGEFYEYWENSRKDCNKKVE